MFKQTKKYLEGQINNLESKPKSKNDKKVLLFYIKSNL